MQEESNINIIILGVAEYTATVFALYAYKMLLIIGYLFYVLILIGQQFPYNSQTEQRHDPGCEF